MLPTDQDAARGISEIIFSRAQLLGVPAALSAAFWPALQRLDLSANRLKMLPEDRGSWEQMPCLCDLNVSHNQIRSVPRSIDACSQLSTVNLRSNDLRHWSSDCLPALSRLPQLDLLDLRYNRRLGIIAVEDGILRANILQGAEEGVPPRRGSTHSPSPNPDPRPQPHFGT